MSEEEIRVAIEKQLREGLASGPGGWIATTNKQEIEFLQYGPTPCCNKNGEFEVFFCDEDGNEKTFRFRVVVESI